MVELHGGCQWITCRCGAEFWSVQFLTSFWPYVILTSQATNVVDRRLSAITMR
jgi:hypothetical protein